ncbi:hypothetical protein [Bacillus marasmi]|uniref:hypothetical protein n=1 Tax=Bacillus marasmi TaxID=1926279 RepID=UPI0011C75329|nr:hypothetical protein [Bacillus marasmi]
MGILFVEKQKVWINIDHPTKRFSLHKVCIYTDKMSETPYKGVGTLKRDGGWLQVKNLQAAEDFYADYYPHYEFVNHCIPTHGKKVV